MLSLSQLEVGQYRNGDSGMPPEPPEDFDMAKFNRGRWFFRNNIYSCTTAMFFSLIIGMNIPEFLEALIFTDASNTPKKAFKRYLFTYGHVLKWHYGDIWEKGSESQKSILIVRSMHDRVREKMSEHFGERERKFLSQYDMGVVLSGFMGSVIMYPNYVGIHCTKSDLDDYVYFWYGVGHMLGIEKEFNICAHGFEQAFTFCKDIERVVYENMKKPPAELSMMSGALLQSISQGRSLTLFTYPAMSALSVDLMEKKRLVALSIPDVIRYNILNFVFFIIRHFSPLRTLLNKGIEKVHGLTFVNV